MNKKERKASKRFDEARRMIAIQYAKLTEQVKPKFTPLPITYSQDHFDYKIVDAYIMKVKKGDWRVLFRFDGEHTDRDKKCKSKTQAEEWVAKHRK